MEDEKSSMKSIAVPRIERICHKPIQRGGYEGLNPSLSAMYHYFLVFSSLPVYESTGQ